MLYDHNRNEFKTLNDVYDDIWFLSRVTERVEKGAKWLDEVRPGWETRIDVSNLDLSDGNSCVCGQVFMQEVVDVGANVFVPNHGYSYALDKLFHGNFEKVVNHGFNLEEDFVVKYSDESGEWLEATYDLDAIQFELLASEWIMQIEKRNQNKENADG